jgi:hypothetical protein
VSEDHHDRRRRRRRRRRETYFLDGDALGDGEETV